MKRLHNSLFLILFIITASCFGYSFKPPTKTGAAGAPDNGETCISCHASSGNGSLVVSDLPNQYQPGEKYTLSVKLSQSGRQRWGFILTALDQNGNQAGTFESNDANTQVFSASGRQYIGHTSSGTAAGQSNSNTWLMDWIAPAIDTGKISFYASGNAANNNGQNTGDNGYKTEVSIEAEVEAGVNIPDPNLRAILRETLGKNEGDAITKEDLATISSINRDGGEYRVKNLKGLEHCTNLIYLNLNNHQVSDVSILSSLANLAELWLGGNQISDISALSNLTNLNILDLDRNQIIDITKLVNLTNLTQLNLVSNNIVDISPVSNLTKLTRLALYDNKVSNISFLTNSTKLTDLELQSNKISDITPLVENTGISGRIKLGNNPLFNTALSTHIPSLVERGIEVEYDLPEGVVLFKDANLEKAIRDALGIPTELLKKEDLEKLEELEYEGKDGAKISDLTGIEHCTSIQKLRLEHNLIADIKLLSGLTKLNSLSLYDNSVTDISPLENLGNITSLSLEKNGLSDIHILSNLTKLSWLVIDYNLISDITALAGLQNLGYVNLNYNQITDISALVNNSGLRGDIRLQSNPLNNTALSTHIPALEARDIKVEYDMPEGVVLFKDANLEKAIRDALGIPTELLKKEDLADLKELKAGSNWDIPDVQKIEDLTGLEHCTNLTYLDLMRNLISDISPLKDLTSLTTLIILDNRNISDISPLFNLTKLTSLNLGRIKPQSGINFLSSLTKLEHLTLEGTAITDISVMSQLPNLTHLNISWNPISDISPLKDLTGLVFLDLNGMQINDILVLVENKNISGKIRLSDNPLNDAALSIHIPTLKTRGIEIECNVLDNIVTFKDANLEKAIRDALGIPTALLEKEDLAKLTKLENEGKDGAQIADLTGLEHCNNIEYLKLERHLIVDIKSLSGLTKLNSLSLYDNSVTDINPLENLVSITSLRLEANGLSDIGTLSKLTKLSWLVIDYNLISDITALAGLQNLGYVNLNYNQITDISSLVNNSGLRGEIRLQSNPLNNTALSTHIPALEARDIKVEYDMPEGVVLFKDANLEMAI